MLIANLTIVGFAAAALMYAALTVLLLVRGAPSRTGRRFVAAVAIEAAWAASVALAAGGGKVNVAVVAAAEAARLFAWVLFLVYLVRGGIDTARAEGESRTLRAASAGLVTAATIAAASLALDVLAFNERPAFVLKVIAAVFGLVCVEQAYQNTPASGRWGIKFLAVALAGMFGFDLVMFSEALLFSRVNPALWPARGLANALVVPLLAVTAARNRNWKLDISVSRDIVFHSTTLFAAGLYLIAMATAGYWVRWFGGDWGEVAQAVMVFAALVALVVVLMSGTLRARLRVFLAKNFFSYRYDYRTEWMKLTKLLSEDPAGAMAPRAGGAPGSSGAVTSGAAASATGTSAGASTATDAAGASRPADAAETNASPRGAEPLEVRALQGLGALVESSGGALWLQAGGNEYTCAARWRYREPAPAIAGDEPLVAFLRDKQWIVSLPEWRSNPRVYGDMRLPAGIASSQENWLIVPLLLHEDLLGFAVLARSIAPSDPDWEVRDALKAASRQVASYLGVRRAVEALVQARQFESFNRMSAFVVHDLKNLVAQLSLLLGNAARHKDNPEFQQDMLETVANVQTRMQGLLMQLRAGTRPIEPPHPVPLAAAVRAALAARRAVGPSPELSIADELADAAVMAHRDRLERVIGHLIQNAAEATPVDGKIWVRVSQRGDQALVEVEDTGRGMSEQFVRDQLFKPFESTKDHGMGIGAFESREYIRELGGTLDVTSREQAGTCFRIRLPLALATVSA